MFFLIIPGKEDYCNDIKPPLVSSFTFSKLAATISATLQPCRWASTPRRRDWAGVWTTAVPGHKLVFGALEFSLQRT